MNGPVELDRENAVVLDTVQALLGLISPNVIAVAVRVGDGHVDLPAHPVPSSERGHHPHRPRAARSPPRRRPAPEVRQEASP